MTTPPSAPGSAQPAMTKQEMSEPNKAGGRGQCPRCQQWHNNVSLHQTLCIGEPIMTPPQPPLGATPEPSAASPDRTAEEFSAGIEGHPIHRPAVTAPQPSAGGRTKAELDEGFARFKEEVRKNYIDFYGEPAPDNLLPAKDHTSFSKAELVSQLLTARAALAQCEERLLGKANSWDRVWNMWEKHPSFRIVSDELTAEGCHGCVTSLNEWIERLTKAEESRRDEESWWKEKHDYQARAESAEAVIKQITEGHPNAALVCELRTRAIDAESKLTQYEDRLAEMTARAMSLVLHLPPETLAGDVQRWRDDVKAELAKLAQCEEKLAKQERDILWVETRISCDDSGAEVLRQREQIERLTAAHAKAREDGKRAREAMDAHAIAYRLWEHSKLRHGLFTPVEFGDMCERIIAEYFESKAAPSVSEKQGTP